MKIKPEDLEVLRARIAPLDTPDLRRIYYSRQFARASAVQDLDKRYRWDLLWMSRIKIGDGVGIKGDLDLYAYMNDDHIDTALRSIVPAIVDNFADVKKPVAPKNDSPIHDPWGLSKLD
jgi:hypothetical protein